MLLSSLPPGRLAVTAQFRVPLAAASAPSGDSGSGLRGLLVAADSKSEPEPRSGGRFLPVPPPELARNLKPSEAV